MKDFLLSPYTAANTACGFLYAEFSRTLPLLMADNAEQLLRDEVELNQYMHVNSLSSRKKFMAEFKRRYASVPRTFWLWFISLDEAGQRAGLLYVILCTYKLFFDFHFNVTLPRWNGIERMVNNSDLLFEISDISTRDAFVDSWSDSTKRRLATQYLTVLRQAGLLDAKTQDLHPLRLTPESYAYYLRTGNDWFLTACLLYRNEVEQIKSTAL